MVYSYSNLQRVCFYSKFYFSNKYFFLAVSRTQQDRQRGPSAGEYCVLSGGTQSRALAL